MGSAIPSIIPVALNLVSKGQKAKNSARDSDLQQQQILQQQQADEEKRQRSLKAAIASRRARYGASGVEAGDGSAEAVLLGMFSQSEEEFENRLERDNLRLRSVEQSAQSSNSRNLLSLTSDVFDNAFVKTFLG